MFRRLSNARDRSESTSPSKSPPSSPTDRIHSFYQHPSGSRFTEEAVSAVLSSETGSDATSLGVSSTHSIPPWRGSRMQPSKLQKLRLAPRPFSRPPPPVHVDEFIGDTSSEITSSAWTVSLCAYRLCARMVLMQIHYCIVDRRYPYQYRHFHQLRCRYIRYRSALYHTLRNRSQSTTGCKCGRTRVLRSSSSAPLTPREVSSAANSCIRPSLPTVMRCETSYPDKMGS
jgi:hypothetical protein